MNHDDNKLPKEENNNESVTDTETVDETASSEEKVTDDTKTNENPNEDTTATENTWHNKNALKRGIAMLGYGFIAGFVRLGITIIAIFQFLSLLFAEKPNVPLVKFGQQLNTYQYQINQFLTVNSEMYPFPFSDFPDSDAKE